MENNKYTGFFLLQEIEGVNLFLSVVAGHWFDCLDFNPFQSSDCDYKKNELHYYLIGQFGHEKNRDGGMFYVEHYFFLLISSWVENPK